MIVICRQRSQLIAVANKGRVAMRVQVGGLQGPPGPSGALTTAGTASEALTAANIVNVWDDAGTVSVRKADATAEGKEATGFVKAGFSIGESATVYLPGDIVTGLSGLSTGTRYYLDTTAGGITSTAPSAGGNVSQCVGTALTTTTLLFNPEPPITVHA